MNEEKDKTVVLLQASMLALNVAAVILISIFINYNRYFWIISICINRNFGIPIRIKCTVRNKQAIFVIVMCIIINI